MQNQSKILIYFSLVATVYLGFLFNENAGGGAKIDQEYLLKHIFEISYNLIDGLIIYVNDPGTLIHSPVFYILVGYILKFSNSFLLINLLYILLSCFLPFIFYLILTSKFNRTNQVIFFLSIIIFFSPYFRSSAIWVLGDNLSLMFFSLSIFFFIKTKKNTLQIKNYFLCLFFLILCCYIRYYYALFCIYYLINFYKKISLALFIQLLLFCLIFSLPASIYFFFIFENYNFFNRLNSYGSINFYSNGLIILSIIFFYFIPFVILQLKEFLKYYEDNLKYLIIFGFIFIFLFIIDSQLFNFFYSHKFGGGVFVKLSNFLNLDSKICIYFVSFISILIINFYFKNDKKNNYFLLILLILSFPVNIIYQKYFDPLFLIILFSLINSEYLKKIIYEKSKYFFVIHVYYLSFFLFSVIYYL